MYKYCFTFFFTIAFAFCSFSQHSQLSTLDAIIERNKTQTSISALDKSFEAPLKNSKSTIERTAVETVHLAMLARLHFIQSDLRNAKSDSLYKLAISKSAKSGSNIVIWANTQYGFYLYSNSLYKDALPYFLTASRLIDKFENDLELQTTDVLKKNAFFFGNIKDYSRAIDYTKKALAITDKISFEYGALLNTLGKNYEAIGNRTLAEKYYNETLESSKNNNDKIRYAKALGDLALLFIADANYEKAEKYLLEDIAISKANGGERNVMFAQIQLGKLYCKTNRNNEAIAVLREAERYANSKLYLKSYEQEIIELKLAIAIAQKDADLELLYRRTLDTIALHVSKTDSDDIINTINLEVQNENIKLQLLAEKKNLQNELLVKKLTIFIGIVLFVLLIVLFVMHRNKLKYQQNEFDQRILSFEIDKVNSETKLEETNYSLESYKTYLLEKNQQVEELEQELARNDSNSANVQQKDDYQPVFNSHLLTEDNWQQFKKEFIKEQNDFYVSTLQKYPNLTESNLRLLMLVKMGFTNANIANLLGVTIDGVKKAKQRLKKKHDDILNDL